MKNSIYKKDRPQLSEEQILKNKNFNETLKNVNSGSNAYLKSFKYWGSGGIAVIAIIASIFLINDKPNIQEENIKGDFTYQPADHLTELTAIKPPFLEHDIPYEIFKVDCSKDEELISKSGTKFYIPSNSLVSKEGNRITGIAEIHYREFRNPVDLFLSGIPMDYDSAGTIYTFETAGMLDIKAFQNESRLALVNSKTINFKFNSTTEDPGYNFYSLDEETGVWNNEQQSIEVTKNEPATETQKKINKSEMAGIQEPIAPIKKNSNKYSLNIAVNKEDYPELEKYEGTIFEINEVDNKFDPIIYKIRWEEAVLSDSKIKDNYTLKLTREDSSIYLTVYPVVKDEAYEKAITLYNEEMDNYKKLSTENSNDFDANDNYASQNLSISQEINVNITREFMIAGFGIYNCDTPQKRPNVLANKKTLDIDGVNIKLPAYYVANTEKNSVVSMYNNNSKKIKYYKKGPSVVWYVDETGGISIINPDQFKNIKERDHLTFERFPPTQGIKTLRDLMVYK